MTAYSRFVNKKAAGIARSCLCTFLLVSTLLFSSTCFAADHLDGPAASADPAADITDVYAWMQNGNQLNLILNVFPLANETSLFSDSVQYAFRISSLASYGGDSVDSTLVCTFSADQSATCTLNGEPLVEGVDASSTEGVSNEAGTFRIFTSLRNDPFFFDLENFNTVRTSVRDTAPSLSFDEAGCPALDTFTQTVLVSSLTGGGGLPEANSPATDFFAPLNVLSIVIRAERGLFGSGPLYSVSASTHRR